LAIAEAVLKPKERLNSRAGEVDMDGIEACDAAEVRRRLEAVDAITSRQRTTVTLVHVARTADGRRPPQPRPAEEASPPPRPPVAVSDNDDDELLLLGNH